MSASSNPHVFVFVSGGWHGAWCWERVVPLLEERGHVALTPELLGMGSDTTPLSEASLAHWADQVADLIGAQARPVILVGHSRGGTVISEVAERVPDRIRSLVYLVAYLLPPGEAIGSASANQLRKHKAPANLRTILPDGTVTVNTELAIPVFFNTTPPEWQARAASLVTPEPMFAFTTPVQVTDERFGTVRRAYIEALQDAAVPLEVQKALQARWPCNPVITLDTDHSPFYSAPEALVEALEEIARQAGDQPADPVS